jgi:diacylglycerol kinase (ATP)
VKILLFYNNHAGNGRARKQKDQILKLFRAAGHEVDIQITPGQERTSRLVEESSFEAYQGVFAAGGDGTIMEVANGYLKNPALIKPPFGIIPIGTGNAFIRDLGYSTGKIKEVIANLDSKNTKWVDAGIAQNGGLPFFFFNILGIGFVSDVILTAQNFKWLGNFAYTIGIFYRAINLKTVATKLEIDGEIFECDTLFVEISNTRYTSNFLMAPDAAFDDGILDITVLKKMSAFRLMKSFPKILSGEHIHLPEVKVMRGKNIKIHTIDPKVISPDGELKGYTPATVGVKHKAIELFY